MSNKPRYSGPNCSGICVCGHSWDEHHLGIVVRPEYVQETGENYIPQECEHYGFNAVNGMRYNEDTGLWEDHCFGYRDERWPDEHN